MKARPHQHSHQCHREERTPVRLGRCRQYAQADEGLRLALGLVAERYVAVAIAVGCGHRGHLEPGCDYAAAVVRRHHLGRPVVVGLGRGDGVGVRNETRRGVARVGIDDDDAALSELARVSAPGSTVLLSAPLHPSRWTKFDALVGHSRRYDPAQLLSKLARHGMSVTATAVYGMQPRSSWLLDLAVWALTHRRRRAIWWYDRVFLRIAALFQPRLKLTPGMMDLTDVDEVLLACRRTGDSP